jgi:hypothetical protein
MQCLSELLELFVGEFRWSPWSVIIVERVFELALFESVEPAIDRLLMPSELRVNIRRRKPLKVFPCSSQAFDCLRIGLVRELLADLSLREVGNLVPVLGHTIFC